MSTKTITLPSGATCRIRRITGRDTVKLGFFPDAMSDDKSGAVKLTEKELKQRQEWFLGLNEIILCDCIWNIRRPDGTTFEVVRTPWKEIPENDTSHVNVDLFSEEPDGLCIVKQVMELSGMTTSAKEAVRPFPEEQGGNGEPGPSGSEIPQAAERVA